MLEAPVSFVGSPIAAVEVTYQDGKQHAIPLSRATADVPNCLNEGPKDRRSSPSSTSLLHIAYLTSEYSCCMFLKQEISTSNLRQRSPGESTRAGGGFMVSPEAARDAASAGPIVAATLLCASRSTVKSEGPGKELGQGPVDVGGIGRNTSPEQLDCGFEMFIVISRFVMLYSSSFLFGFRYVVAPFLFRTSQL